MSNGGKYDRFVLAGPTTPHWACFCGTGWNYASRIKCRGCGRDAPQRICNSAREAAKRASTKPAFDRPRGAGGAWSKGPPNHQSELDKLRAENAELRRAGKNEKVEEETTPAEDADEGTDIEELIGAVAKLEKAVGPSHPLVTAARTELEVARRKRDEARPARYKISALRKKMHARNKAAEAAEKKVGDLREAAKNAEAAVTEGIRLRNALATEVAEIEEELSRLRQEELRAETRTNEVPRNAESIFGGLDPQFVATSTSMEEHEALQRAETIMARVRQQRVSEAATVQEQLPPTVRDAPTIAASTAVAASAAERRAVDSAPMQVEDVAELERQAQLSERQAEHARERAESAKKARVA